MNIETTLHNDYTINTAISPTSTPTNSIPDPKQISKIILRSALQKANIAVQCDSKNDVIGAINSYNEAIMLLERVLLTVDKESDRKRLQDIHDSYSERIQLLSTITSKLEIDSGPESPFTPQDDTEWITKPFNNTHNNTHAGNITHTHTHTHINKLNSIDTHPKIPSAQRSRWQDYHHPTPSPSFRSIHHTPISPTPSPLLTIHSSKSTPTKKHSDYDDKNESPTLDQVIKPPPPRFSSIPQPQSNINIPDIKSARSSMSSYVSHSSSLDMSEEEEEEMVAEQPVMALPSLKQKEDIPPKSIFRTRTSSLPRKALPIMTRSLSMNTIDKSISEFDDYNQETSPTTDYIPMRRNLTQPISEQSMDGMDLSQENRLSRSNYINDEQVSPNNVQYNETSHMKLLMALEKSMYEGAHITYKLYIPKNLWLQPNIRLSSMDVKVSACEHLMIDMSKLENWPHMADVLSTIKLIDKVETSVELLQLSLAKKLKRESMMEGNNHQQPSQSTTVNNRDSMSPIKTDNSKKAQSFMSWSNKLSKSVERMNAFSLTKTEDQFKHYIDVLQRLFMKIHVLDKWINFYHEERRKMKHPQHDILLFKLTKICDIISTTVGGFVIRDVTILLAKWLKRGGSWVNE
ncbi:hypothetical protein BDB01DRAFT_847846 [Pilobolus umbonatus]|nr:hypothetical protein BDB01DRAFT_847846 [Pilobolus umbonatus]